MGFVCVCVCVAEKDVNVRNIRHCAERRPVDGGHLKK